MPRARKFTKAPSAAFSDWCVFGSSGLIRETATSRHQGETYRRTWYHALE